MFLHCPELIEILIRRSLCLRVTLQHVLACVQKSLSSVLVYFKDQRKHTLQHHLTLPRSRRRRPPLPLSALGPQPKTPQHLPCPDIPLIQKPPRLSPHHTPLLLNMGKRPRSINLGPPHSQPNSQIPRRTPGQAHPHRQHQQPRCRRRLPRVPKTGHQHRDAQQESFLRQHGALDRHPRLFIPPSRPLP